MKDSDLYVQILRWAYEKGDQGFYWNELEEKFCKNPEERSWVRRIFLPTLPGEKALITNGNYLNDKNAYQCFLNSNGIAAAMQYLILEDAREGGKKAQKTANWALGIGAIVGIVQICIDLFK